MIIHDTSLNACATYKCLGVEESRAEDRPMGGTGRILGRHWAFTVPGWLALRPGRRVITPSRRHYAHPLRLMAGRQ